MKINLKYLVLFLTSLLVLCIAYFIEHPPLPPKGEYFWSKLLGACFNRYVMVIFLIMAFISTYQFKMNPWKVALSCFIVFPIVSLLEASFYRGSHNLIPFEFFGLFLISMPYVAVGYLGKWLQKKRAESKID
jgi:surface polysaccharide O-acyltransferase-like enzyme